MKKFSLALILVSVLAVFSLAALSQIQSTQNISLEEKETCYTAYNNNTQFIYSSCNYYHNYTYCSNISGPDTGCSLQQQIKNISCQTGEQVITTNQTICNPNNQFIITINQSGTIAKKKLDFPEWACIYTTENDCLIVTCQSIYDGANDGQFHGCAGGTTCQKFEICGDSVKAYYKNSQDGFAEEDPTFYLDKLALQEAGQ